MEIYERYWLAGLLEGEGSFYSAKSRGGYRYPTIALNMTDEDTVLRARQVCGGGGSFYTWNDKRGRKLQYRLVITGRKAREIMAEIFPIMGERRQKQITRAWFLSK